MQLKSLAPPPNLTCTATAIATLRAFLDGSASVCALTGAGMSTESGIPDYRSPRGSYSKGHKPILHQEFVKQEHLRRRYWARSLIGYRHFRNAKPNAAHYALANLQKMGCVTRTVTQNVDCLQTLAGSADVIEIHGANHSVQCLGCGERFSRPDFQAELELVNAGWIERWLGKDLSDLKAVFAKLEKEDIREDIRADADFHIDKADFEAFQVPSCKACGTGLIKPTLVFFGDNVEKAVAEAAMEAVTAADRLLVMGTSLSTYSAFRLAKAAAERGKEILVLNIGETRADGKLAVKAKIEGRCGELLPRVLPAGMVDGSAQLGLDVSADGLMPNR